ncbi:MAG: bifunctional lytic transglycosylase/C40 family peptidase [Acidimicrobiales bacterium]
MIVVVAVAGAALLAGSGASAAGPATNLHAAEVVAARFVSGFEGFSYRNPMGRLGVADLATPGLAARLDSSSQAAPGPVLVAERFTTSADVTAFEVEDDTGASVRLLADTTERISTVRGSTTTVRLIPVSLTVTPSGWKVSAISALLSSGTSSADGRSGAGTATAQLTNAPVTGSSPGTGSAVTVIGDIPPEYLAWMKAAVAAECPGLPWEVLAGIAKVESDFGESTLPGVASGSNYAGAEGPMQFEPATFRAYGIVAPGGADPRSPYDPDDAIFSAARLLCADGGGSPGLLDSAIFDYNHSDAYVSLVLGYAAGYEQDADGGTNLTAAMSGSEGTAQGVGLGSVIVADAEAYLGTPYVWGGEQPGVGFDCSGLVQWVYAEAGISLPRVAQDQYDVGPHLPAGATLYPGDLVFFGSGPDGVEHVGIYVGNGEMIDAPYTGVDVRFDRVASVPLRFVGATRPEIPDLSSVAGVPVVATETSDVTVDAPSTSTGSRRAGAATGTRGSTGTAGTGTGSTVTRRDRSHPKRHTSSPGSTTTTTPRRGRHGKGHPTTTTTTDPPSADQPAPTTTQPVTTTTPPRPGRPGRAPGATTTTDPTATTRPKHHRPPTTTTQPAPTTTTAPPPTTTTTSTVPPVATSTTTIPLATTSGTAPPSSTTTPTPHPARPRH